MKKAILLTIIMLFSTGLLNLKAQENDGVRLKHYALKNNLALQGYDPVSYFVGKPLKGKKYIYLNTNQCCTISHHKRI